MSWGQYANVELHQRYMQPVQARSRCRCWCGCKQRATHSGMCNGMSMITGCELVIRRWVRDGLSAVRQLDPRRHG